MKVSISKADADAMGVPTSVEVDATRLRMKDVRALREASGYDFETLVKQLKSGKDFEALGIAAWFTYYQAGHKIPYEEFDVDLSEVEIDSGKASTLNSSNGSTE